MCIDEASEGGRYNNTCFTEPFPERCGGDKNTAKGQAKCQSCRKAEGSATLRFTRSFPLQSSYRENNSIDDRNRAGANQRYRQGLKSCDT